MDGREVRMPNDRRDWLEGMSVSVDVGNSTDTEERRYFGTITEVMDDDDGKHGVILLVQDAAPNFATPPDHSLRDALGKLSQKFPPADALDELDADDMSGCRLNTVIFSTKEIRELRTLLAQASNASSLAKELQAKPAAGTPTTEGE